MKKDINRRVLWTAFLKPPSEDEILEAAKFMKGGKAYLFEDENGLIVMRNRRRLNEFEKKHETFVKRIL